MLQLIIESFASYGNFYRISLKNGGISSLCRHPLTVSNSLAKHGFSRPSTVLSRSVQTLSLLSTGHLTNRQTLNYETTESSLNGSVTSYLLHTIRFKNETRSFSTLPAFTVLNGSTFNKIAHTRFRHRSVKSGDSSKEKGEETDLEDEDDNNEEVDDDGDLSHLTFPEDTGFPNNYREVKVHLKSLRLDAVVSAGLNTARNKVDDYFLESKLKLNGERVLKKSKQMKIGDFADIVMSVVDGKPRVKRVRVLKVDEDKTSKDKLKVTVRAWRTAVLVNSAGG